MNALFAGSIFLNLLLVGLVFSSYSLRGAYSDVILVTLTVFLSLVSLYFLFVNRTLSRLLKFLISLFYFPSFVVLYFVIFFAVTNQLIGILFFAFYPPRCVTDYFSTTGQTSITIKEDCFGFACSHEAYLNRFIFEKPLGKLNVGDAERCVFTRENDVQMKWNDRENEVEWTTDTRHGMKTGVIPIKQ